MNAFGQTFVCQYIPKDMAMIYELVNGLFKTEYTTYSTATSEAESTEMDS